MFYDRCGLLYGYLRGYLWHLCTLPSVFENSRPNSPGRDCMSTHGGILYSRC